MNLLDPSNRVFQIKIVVVTRLSSHNYLKTIYKNNFMGKTYKTWCYEHQSKLAKYLAFLEKLMLYLSTPK